MNWDASAGNREINVEKEKASILCQTAGHCQLGEEKKTFCGGNCYSLPSPPPHNKSCRRPSVSRNDNHLSAFPSLSLPPSLFLSTRRARLAKKASLWRERERESVRTSVGKSIPAGAFPGDRKKERGKNGNLQSTFALGCLVILIFPPQLYILGSSSLY